VTLAAKLRQRVTLQSRVASQDATTGETTFTWSNTVADEPAEVVPLSGREFIQSGATQASVDTHDDPLAFRYRADNASGVRWQQLPDHGGFA